MELRADEQVGDFQIEAILEEVSGNICVTYRARDMVADQLVEVTEYLPRALVRRREDGTVEPNPPEVAEDYKRGRRQFLAEATALQNCLQGPGTRLHVASVRTVFETRGTVYLVTEHIEGLSLAEVLKDGPRSTAWVWRMLDGLTADLVVAHDMGVVHGAVTPARVRVRPDGTPVLTAFGLGQRATTASMGRRSDELADGYAALEQYTGGEIGPWTDIHALGALAYTALSTRSLPAALSRKNEGNPVEPLAAVTAALGDSGLASAIMAALALEPEVRPSDLGAWRVQLGLASPATATGRTGPQADRWWKAAAVAAISVLAVTVAVMGTQLSQIQIRQVAADQDLADRIAAQEEGETAVPRVQSGVIYIDDDADGIGDNSRGCPELDRNPYRGHTGRRVDFPQPFESIPEVVAAISSIDHYNDHNLRLHVRVDSVDNQGFDYTFRTWCNTRLASAAMQWMAVAK